MVSTRGVKLKFVDGERVLCYEPDPTKAKVLYDSKVRQVVVNKDQRGRKTVEYLIHFQGWNSSWDRCVGEDFVLKDTEENRALQRELAEKAQLQLGAYLYRRDKKRSRKLSDRINESLQHWSEDGSSDSQARMDTDDNIQAATSSSDTDSSFEDDVVPLELTQTLRYFLEIDNELITQKNKLIRLPAEPNVITILEDYLKHYATCQMCGITEKPKTRQKIIVGLNKPKHNVDNIYRNLNVCKEMIDGLRVYFDFTLADLLLYNDERKQAATYGLKSSVLKMESEPEVVLIKREPENYDVKTEDTEEFAHLPKLLTEDNSTIYDDIDRSPDSTNGSRRSSIAESLPGRGFKDQQNNYSSVRRRLRSCRISQHSESAMDASDVTTNGFNYDSLALKQEASGTLSSIASTGSDCSSPLTQVLAWKLLPDDIKSKQPNLPSLIYGAIHLTRLFVKLPELLWASNMPETKLKLLLQHLDSFVDYLDEHKEWFGEKQYID